MRVAIATVILVLLVACVSVEKPTEKPVKIGGLFGLTGFASFAGEASRDGFIMAIEDSGMNVSYVIEDFKSDLKETATVAKKLIEVDDVKVIIGPEWNEFAEVVWPISVEKKVVFVSPWMTSEEIKSDYYFTMTPSERSQIRKLGDYMARQGVRTVVVIAAINAWALGNVKVFKDEIEKGGKIKIVDEFEIDQEAVDYRTEILQIKKLNPDALYTVLPTDNGQGTLHQQLQELDAKYPVYLPHSRAESPIFVENFAKFANGAIYSAPEKYKNIEQFNEKYQARFGKLPGAISAATAYDATMVVLDAIKKGARTSEEIRTYLLNVKDYDGYSNLIRFNEDGQQDFEDVIIKQISGNTSVVLEE